MPLSQQITAFKIKMGARAQVRLRMVRVWEGRPGYLLGQHAAQGQHHCCLDQIPSATVLVKTLQILSLVYFLNMHLFIGEGDSETESKVNASPFVSYWKHSHNVKLG